MNVRYRVRVAWATVVQILGWLLLCAGIGWAVPWAGVALAGAGMVLFGVAAEASADRGGP